MKKSALFVLIPAFACVPLCVHAQDNNAPLAAPPAGDASAQLEVRLSTIEDELRSLRGRIEEDNFQIRKLSDSLSKYQKDTDYRLNALSGSKPAAAESATNETTAAPVEPLSPSDRKAFAATPEAQENPPPQNTDETAAGNGALELPADTGSEDAPMHFATPREHYNYAFRLLNQTQYDQAAKSFSEFTKKYPKDPLIGNAYYWQGETYYIRRDYVNAANNFRQGFEALPNGPKAADNLLKLAMSLDALNRDKEACVVLQQITAKYKKASASVADKAVQEQKRIGCQ